MNRQKPLPFAEFNGKYAVHSMFLTIQGEGPFSGDAAFFIRLEGCNLQCPGCDTEYTGGARAERLEARHIVDRVLQEIDGTGCTLVVITGGEPFRQDLTALVFHLWEVGLRVQIETNGTLEPTPGFKALVEGAVGRNALAIVVSPKAHFVSPFIEDHAIAYKYVLSHDSIDSEDGLPVEVLGRKSQRVARPKHPFTQVFIQPADPAMMHLSFEEMGEVTKTNHKAVVASAIKFGYRAQLQMHKYIGVE